jgi:hypothetical protein
VSALAQHFSTFPVRNTFSPNETASMYARACRAWYGPRAALIVKRRIEELQRAGDLDGVRIWTQIADQLSQLQASRPIGALAARLGDPRHTLTYDRFVFALRASTLIRTESDRSTRLLHRHAVECSTYPRALARVRVVVSRSVIT